MTPSLHPFPRPLLLLTADTGVSPSPVLQHFCISSYPLWTPCHSLTKHVLALKPFNLLECLTENSTPQMSLSDAVTRTHFLSAKKFLLSISSPDSSPSL
jgi:hypothetical protein